MRQTEPDSLADDLRKRTEALSRTYGNLLVLGISLRELLSTRPWAQPSEDRSSKLSERWEMVVIQVERERLTLEAMEHWVRKDATASQLDEYLELRLRARIAFVYASQVSYRLALVHFLVVRTTINKIIEQQPILEELRGANERQRLRQRLELLQDLEASQTILREPPIYDHWRREGGALDLAALFEGVNEPGLARALDNRSKQHEEAIIRAPDGALSLSLLAAPLGWGFDALQRSYRRSLRSAYADEAPAEGLRRANGVRLSRYRGYDPKTGEETDGLDLLPAGGSSPEDLDPEEILVQKEERERQVRCAEAAFHAELDSLYLSAKQREVLLDYFLRAPLTGHGPASKKSSSMRQYWGADYGAKQRMRQRLEEAHPAFFDKWSGLLLGTEKPEPS